MGARAANTTRRKVRLECMLAEPSGDPESRIGIRRLRKRMLWFFRFLASRPPVPLPAPVILAAWRCTPDWEPLPKKSLKATGRARQKEVSRAKALEVEYSSARRGPSSTLYFLFCKILWSLDNGLIHCCRWESGPLAISSFSAFGKRRLTFGRRVGIEELGLLLLLLLLEVP